MNKAFIAGIKFYQTFCSPLLKQIFGVQKMCRHEKTCSSYALWAFQTHPVIPAARLSVQRILSCSPRFGLSRLARAKVDRSDMDGEAGRSF